MTGAGTLTKASPLPALSVLALTMLLLGAAYHHFLTDSEQRLDHARDMFERVAWISDAKPEWQAKFDLARQVLQDNPPFIRAARPQIAATELQSTLRQALMTAGGTIDSLQSNVGTAQNGKLVAIRAVIVARSAPERIVDVLRALEAVETPLGFESVDIAIQQTAAKDSPQGIATLTIAIRTFVLGDDNAG